MPGSPLIAGAMNAATIVEFLPANIATFVMCQSLSNPEVAAATTAAMGALTPMPCVPMVVAPWEPASEIMSLAGLPFATQESKCTCAYGGSISVTVPFQGPEDTE